MSGWRRRERVVVSSSQIDAGLNLIGGSPFPGDMTASGVPIPAEPTVSQDTRYLVRCCGLSLNAGEKAIIRSLSFQLTIGADVEQEDGTFVPFEIPVLTPGWRFPDGNATFHVRQVNDGRPTKSDPHQMAWGAYPMQWSRNGLSSVILGRVVDGFYEPLNAGMPYGTGIGGLGTVHDVRWPVMQPPSNDLDLEVQGPNEVVVYASVHQTNPATRVIYNGSLDISHAVCKEDWFSHRFERATRYWRVGANMIADIYVHQQDGPPCEVDR